MEYVFTIIAGMILGYILAAVIKGNNNFDQQYAEFVIKQMEKELNDKTIDYKTLMSKYNQLIYLQKKQTAE